MRSALFKYILVLFAFAAELSAQNELITEPTLLYRKRHLYGINLNSAELGGLQYQFQWQKTALIKNGFQVELARLRHPKEERIYSQSPDPRKYTPGRVNMAFFLRTGYGQNLFITDRNYKTAISLHYNYTFGLTTAMLKPIYIDVLKTSNDPSNQQYVTSEKYDPVDKHNNPFIIYGNSGFAKGFSESTFNLGLHFKNSLSVEWGAYPDAFQSLEAGFVVDVFPSTLKMMAPEYGTNNNIFVTLFVGFNLGYNK